MEMAGISCNKIQAHGKAVLSSASSSPMVTAVARGVGRGKGVLGEPGPEGHFSSGERIQTLKTRTTHVSPTAQLLSSPERVSGVELDQWQLFQTSQLLLSRPKFESWKPERPQRGENTKAPWKQGSAAPASEEPSWAPESTPTILHTGHTPQPGFLQRGRRDAFHVSGCAEGLRVFV